jgi:hypothetical protein
MGKSTFFTGQPVFNQILSLVPRNMVTSLVKEYEADRYCKKFRTYDHLVTMLYSVFHGCSSLREVITGMQAMSSRLVHLGVLSCPRRSTLADANEGRTADLFADLYHKIYQRYYGSLPDSLKGKKILDRLFVIDSTIISLFSTVMHSTGSYGLNGKKKGGAKAHLVLKAKENVPCFIRLTHGKQGDSSFLPLVKVPERSIVVMDKGYRNYQQLISWNEQNITWVSRLNARSVYKVVKLNDVNSHQHSRGVRQDAIIELGNPKTASINPVQKARLITFDDAMSGKQFYFITNNFEFSAYTIAGIYKRRWQIELLFKRIKQNFQLHCFLGDNENAIKTQLWCTFIADLLLKIVNDQVASKRKWSMSNLASLIRLHLGTYIALYDFLCNPEKALIGYKHPNNNMQLSIFPNNRGG